MIKELKVKKKLIYIAVIIVSLGLLFLSSEIFPRFMTTFTAIYLGTNTNNMVDYVESKLIKQ